MEPVEQPRPFGLGNAGAAVFDGEADTAAVDPDADSDYAVLAGVAAAALAAKGVGGWWRIAKNLTRYGLRVGPEHPAAPEFWQQALRDAGLAEVCFEPVAAEAGIVRGVRPPSGITGTEPERRRPLLRLNSA